MFSGIYLSILVLFVKVWGHFLTLPREQVKEIPVVVVRAFKAFHFFSDLKLI